MVFVPSLHSSAILFGLYSQTVQSSSPAVNPPLYSTRYDSYQLREEL